MIVWNLIQQKNILIATTYKYKSEAITLKTLLKIEKV